VRELLGEKWKSSAFIAKAAAISNREDLGALDSGGSAFLIGAATETAQQSPRYVYGGGAAGRKNFGQLDSLLDSAIQDLEQPAAKAAPTDPVYTYLLQAQFSAYENKSDALAYGCRAPNPPPGKRVPTAAELQAAQSKMNKFYCGLRSNTPKTTVDALIEFWTTILGLNIPDASVCSLQ